MARPKKEPGHNYSTEQKASAPLLLDEELDTTDTGSETLHRYRYQHAYGVILLARALATNESDPYIDLWCEHHNDLAARRASGLFDIYQIKTRRNGSWSLADKELKNSIKQFVRLEAKYARKIASYTFVTNADYKRGRKAGSHPVEFVEAIGQAVSPDAIPIPFRASFEELVLYCQGDPLDVFGVLRKLKLPKGPGIDSFEDEIALSHLAPLMLCQHITGTKLSKLCDELINQIARASTSGSRNPARHWYGLNEPDRQNPQLLAKIISLEKVHTFIQKNYAPVSHFTDNSAGLSTNVQETLKAYLRIEFEKDHLVTLDQAGDVNPERITPLHQVFIDLELKPRADQPKPPRKGQFFSEKLEQLLLTSAEVQQVEPGKFLETRKKEEKSLSAMECFLQEKASRFVIIGGPGQGKSTLGQYLAQVHRAILLQRENEFQRSLAPDGKPRPVFRPKTTRMPFRIILKDFAQWLANQTQNKKNKNPSVEAYIAQQICQKAARSQAVKDATVHKILKAWPSLLIFDGLDEVIEPELSQQMISCIYEFLTRAEQSDADIQVIATSRPTSYKDQYSPELFWHLELQPLSPAKATEYAANWTHIKEPSQDERKRLLKTLEAHLNEQHTSGLLQTPLQVTIILLIIKLKGDPPHQREELFQKYWDIILDREKTKLEGGALLRTSAQKLFDLHARLGYVLHRNAASKNTRSLLSIDEFEKLVIDFLQAKDSRKTVADIQTDASQLIAEARTRLVLIIEPTKGLFGFELRSLQEFFAAVYLVQTPIDTNQRFARLKAIVPAEHWHNVALFAAGRIANKMLGEAANLLEKVCRPLDREDSGTYLRPGARFALDMATDAVFTEDPNLQYSAVECALSIVSRGMIDQDLDYLHTTLLKLPSENRALILKPLLQEKLASAPLLWSPGIVNMYGDCIGVDDHFNQALQTLCSSPDPQILMEALNLGVRYKVEPSWLTARINENWHILIVDGYFSAYMHGWWIEEPNYAQKILEALSEEQTNEFMDTYIRLPIYYHYPPIKYDPYSVGNDPISRVKQIELFFHYLATTNQVPSFKGIRGKFTSNGELKIYQAPLKENMAVNDLITRIFPIETLKQLIRRSDLKPQLKMGLWSLYWQSSIPEIAEIETFFNECSAWSKVQSLSEWRQFFFFFHSEPLLYIALEYQKQNEQHEVKTLFPFLSQLAALTQQIRAILEKNVPRLSHTDQLVLVINEEYPAQSFSRTGASG